LPSIVVAASQQRRYVLCCWASPQQRRYVLLGIATAAPLRAAGHRSNIAAIAAIATELEDFRRIFV
jgi:hypothetical protein